MWTLAHLAMHASEVRQRRMHRIDGVAVGHVYCVLHCYKLVVAPGFLLLLASTRVSRALRSHTSGSARFRQSSVPALRSGVLDISLRPRLSGPTIPTSPPGALGALGALSSNARARSLAARSLPLSPLPLDRRSLVEPSLSACGGFLSQASRPAAAAAAPILHFFRWVAKICLALLPLKTAPQRHAAPSQLV